MNILRTARRILHARSFAITLLPIAQTGPNEHRLADLLRHMAVHIESCSVPSTSPCTNRYERDVVLVIDDQLTAYKLFPDPTVSSWNGPTCTKGTSKVHESSIHAYMAGCPCGSLRFLFSDPLTFGRKHESFPASYTQQSSD